MSHPLWRSLRRLTGPLVGTAPPWALHRRLLHGAVFLAAVVIAWWGVTHLSVQAGRAVVQGQLPDRWAATGPTDRLVSPSQLPSPGDVWESLPGLLHREWKEWEDARRWWADPGTLLVELGPNTPRSIGLPVAGRRLEVLQVSLRAGPDQGVRVSRIGFEMEKLEGELDDWSRAVRRLYLFLDGDGDGLVGPDDTPLGFPIPTEPGWSGQAIFSDLDPEEARIPPGAAARLLLAVDLANDLPDELVFRVRLLPASGDTGPGQPRIRPLVEAYGLEASDEFLSRVEGRLPLHGEPMRISRHGVLSVELAPQSGPAEVVPDKPTQAVFRFEVRVGGEVPLYPNRLRVFEGVTREAPATRVVGDDPVHPNQTLLGVAQAHLFLDRNLNGIVDGPDKPIAEPGPFRDGSSDSGGRPYVTFNLSSSERNVLKPGQMQRWLLAYDLGDGAPVGKGYQALIDGRYFELHADPEHGDPPLVLPAGELLASPRVAIVPALTPTEVPEATAPSRPSAIPWWPLVRSLSFQDLYLALSARYLHGPLKPWLLPDATLRSVERMGLGSLWALVVGLLLATLMGGLARVSAALSPLRLLGLCLPFPFVALAALSAAPSEGGRILVVALAQTAVLLPLVSREMARVPAEPVEMARALGATRWQQFRLVVLDHARQGTREAIVLSLALGWTGLLLAEALVPQAGGLGALLISAYQRADLGALYGIGFLTLGLVGLTLGLGRLILCRGTNGASS